VRLGRQSSLVFRFSAGRVIVPRLLSPGQTSPFSRRFSFVPVNLPAPCADHPHVLTSPSGLSFRPVHVQKGKSDPPKGTPRVFSLCFFRGKRCEGGFAFRAVFLTLPLVLPLPRERFPALLFFRGFLTARAIRKRFSTANSSCFPRPYVAV